MAKGSINAQRQSCVHSEFNLPRRASRQTHAGIRSVHRKHQEAQIITTPDDFLIDAVIDAVFGSPLAVDFTLPPLPKHRVHTWKQRDVTRALRACQAAGVDVRVEILLDGKLVLIPIASTPGTDDTDTILARLK
jgi:hypothetical protein